MDPIYTSSPIDSYRYWSDIVKEYLPRYCLTLYNISLYSIVPMCTGTPLDSYVYFKFTLKKNIILIMDLLYTVCPTKQVLVTQWKNLQVQ